MPWRRGSQFACASAWAITELTDSGLNGAVVRKYPSDGLGVAQGHDGPNHAVLAGLIAIEGVTCRGGHGDSCHAIGAA